MIWELIFANTTVRTRLRMPRQPLYFTAFLGRVVRVVSTGRATLPLITILNPRWVKSHGYRELRVLSVANLSHVRSITSINLTVLNVWI